MADEKQPPKIVAIPLEQARRAAGETRVALPRSKVASLRAFRRVRMDRILGALGVILTVLGIALMFTWEAAPIVEKKFKVEWPTTARSMENWTQFVPATANTTSKTFNLAATNVTLVQISVGWRDEVGDDALEGDRFHVTIEGPPGSNVSRRQDLGTYLAHTANFSFPLSGIPDVSNWPARTEQEARAGVGDRTNRTGTGEWKITVRLVKANHDYRPETPPDVKANDVCQDAFCQRDPGQEFTLRFTYTTYTAKYSKLF